LIFLEHDILAVKLRHRQRAG